MEPRISLITLGVSDLERATRFYEECLGVNQRPIFSTRQRPILSTFSVC